LPAALALAGPAGSGRKRLQVCPRPAVKQKEAAIMKLVARRLLIRKIRTMSTNMFHTGLSAPHAVQAALVTTGHNIARPQLKTVPSLLDAREYRLTSRLNNEPLMKPKRLISIRASLFWLVTVSLLPAILIAGGLLWLSHEQGQAELANASLVNARTLSARVDREFEAVESSLVALATSPYLASRNFAAFHEQARTVASLRFIESIALFDAIGNQLVHTASPYGAALPLAVNLEQIQRVLKTGRPEISDLFVGPVHKKLILHAAIPVQSGDAVPHVLVGVMLPDRFHKILSDFPLPAGNIASAFDGSSAIAAVVGIEGSSDKLIGRQVNPGLASALSKADEGSLNTINPQGIEIRTAFSRSAASRWGVAVGIPRINLLAPLERSLWLLVGGSLLILGIGIAFAWILGGRIATTIQALQLGAAQLGRGNLVVLPELPIREANDAGQSLTRAASRLADASAALKNSEARMRGILQSAMDAIITVDDTQTIVLFNAAAAAMFDCPAEGAIGTSLTRFVPARFHAQHAGFLKKQEQADGLDDAAGPTGVTVGLRLGGEEFPAEISFSSVVESGARLNTLIIRDVTSRVKAYKALERSNLDLQQFAYVASHDLKTPLRSIAGFVQLLEKNHGEQLDDKARALIRRTTDATKRLEKLTEDLLSYARIGAHAKVFAAVSMSEIAHEVVHLNYSSITSTLAVVTVDDLPLVLGDRTQMVQLLLNLVENALKYCRDRAPVIKLSAVQVEDEWVFSVSDNGIGIEPQHHEKVFEVFKRLHSQSEFPGTGIGLAVCRRVVEGHGGKIWVTSEPGQGSVFSFTLPARLVETSHEN